MSCELQDATFSETDSSLKGGVTGEEWCGRVRQCGDPIYGVEIRIPCVELEDLNLGLLRRRHLAQVDTEPDDNGRVELAARQRGIRSESIAGVSGGP